MHLQRQNTMALVKKVLKSDNHTTSFRNKSREKNTELSKYIWELKVNDG